jgi:hypothetical protein
LGVSCVVAVLKEALTRQGWSREAGAVPLGLPPPPPAAAAASERQRQRQRKP